MVGQGPPYVSFDRPISSRKEVRAVKVTTDVRAGMYPVADPNG
jgi:hypothetical protein